MAFTAGDLCCASNACVLLDTSSTSSEVWDLIPHATQMSFNTQVTTPKLVTSSSAGQEISVCGTEATTGVLAFACHDGVSPGLLCANYVYRLRWSVNCENIWDSGAVVGPADPDTYFEARVRITSVPIDYNISGNQAVVYNYGWELVEWINTPTCQSDSGDA